MDFMGAIEKGRKAFKALGVLQSPGEVAKLLSRGHKGQKSKHVKMVLLRPISDPQSKQNDLKSPLTCLDGLHRCYR